MEKPDVIFATRVKKFGNSYHVIIPKEQVKSLKLDRIRIEIYKVKK